MQDDEQATLESARHGSLDAFNRLVLSHQDVVYGVCLRLLGTPAAAEDAAQEAFISAWKNIGRLRGERFRPWLLRIAANACTDEMRRRGRRPSSSLDLALEAGVPEPADTAPAPETAAMTAELRGQIEAALRRLPEDQRLALVLCDVEQFGYEEIAQVMRTSIGTVKSRISRGRARLRAILLSDPELLPGRYRP